MSKIQRPQVSVVIPVHNIEAHLRQCLDSVANQTLPDFEVVCVDDGSTDASSEILREYSAQDRRFHIIRQENSGPGVARNRGLEQAMGEYLVFWDSDDWFEPNFLAYMVERARQTDADIIVCRADEFDTQSGRRYDGHWMLKTQLLPSDTFAPEEVAWHLFQFTYGWPWDKLYRMDFVRGMGLWYPSLSNSEDLVFVFQSLALAKRIAVLDMTLAHHRVNRLESVSHSRRVKPEAPFQALSLLKEALECRGLAEMFEHTFLNWGMEFLMWNITNMEDKDAQRTYFRNLKQNWLPQMGFEKHPVSYYDNRITYAKYLLLKYSPYPVFAALLSAYRVCKGWRRSSVGG